MKQSSNKSASSTQNNSKSYTDKFINAFSSLFDHDNQNQTEVKSSQQNSKWNCFYQDELEHILQLRRNISSESRNAKQEDRFSFLVDTVEKSFKHAQNRSQDMNNINEIHDSFIQRTRDVESNLLPPNFGHMLLKTSFALFCDNEITTSNQSEMDLSEILFSEPNGNATEFPYISEDKYLTIMANWLQRKGDKFSILRILFGMAVLSTDENQQPLLSSLLLENLDDDDTEDNESFHSVEDGSLDTQVVLANVDLLLDLTYRLAVSVRILDDFVDCEECRSHSIPALPKEIASIRALANSLLESSFLLENTDKNNTGNMKRRVPFKAFVKWHNSKFPYLSTSFSALMKRIIFPRLVTKRAYSSFRFFPDLTGNKISVSSNQTLCFDPMKSSSMYGFACASKDFQGKWHKLYTSDVDGLSFNRLQLALFGYNGPTIMIIQETSSTGAKLGAYTTSRWKESSDFYGSDGNCFLFQIRPDFKIMLPLKDTRSKRRFNYCKVKAPFIPGQARGIGFGGTINKPRLFISESFEDCHAFEQDFTFEKGHLLPPVANEFGDLMQRTKFDIEYLDAWGVGGDDVVEKALGAQNLHRAVADASLQKARKVDKSQFLNDFRSGLIESKAFVHREQIRGREGN